MQEWPLRSYLELGALPTAVPCARLHAKILLYEWGMRALADRAELLVSEIITNAVRATADLDGRRGENGRVAGLSAVRLWLNADGRQVLIQVWDANRDQPIPQEAGLDSEEGRGLFLVAAFSQEWGCYTPDAEEGKIVWALLGGA